MAKAGAIDFALGKRVRDARLAAGLSQAQLGGTGLSASYVSLIEAGARMPSDRALAALAERMHVTVDFLRTGVGPDVALQTELELRHAELSLTSGDSAEAETRFRHLLTRPAAPVPRLQSQFGLARALEAQGKLDAAIVEYERVLVLVEATPSVVSPLRCTVALSRCYREAGDLAHAVDVAAQAVAQGERLGLLGSDAETELLSTLAFAHLERGDLHRAQYLLERALDLADQAGSRRARGAALWNVSILAHERGDLAVAIKLSERALALFAEEDDARSMARLRNVLGSLLIRGDAPDPVRGMALLQVARASLEVSGSTVDVAYCDTEIARGHLMRGQPSEALAVTRLALSSLGEDTLEASRALLVAAAAWLELGDPEAAAESRRMAGASLSRAGASRQAAGAWAELASHYERIGAPTAANDAYRQMARALGIEAPTALREGLAVQEHR